MRALVNVIFLFMLTANNYVLAHEKLLPSTKPATANTLNNTDDAVRSAVFTVDQFNKALVNADVDTLQFLLDDNVLILESGGAEHNAKEYLNEHAIADIVFMQNAKVKLLFRSVQTTADMAWVASESEISTLQNADPQILLSTETMILKRTTNNAWKIIHIHWSSHTKK